MTANANPKPFNVSDGLVVGPAVRAARGRPHFCRPYGIIFYRPKPYQYVALACFGT